MWGAYHSSTEWYQFDRWLDRQFKSNSAFGKRDRRWYSQYLFAGLRYAEICFNILGSKINYSKSESVKQAFVQNNNDRFWSIIEKRAAFEEKAFQVSDADTKAIESIEHDDCLWAGLPVQWRENIDQRAEKSEWTDSDKKNFYTYLGKKAPLWIRLSQDTYDEEIKAELAHENIKILEENSEAFSLDGNKSLYALKSFEKGAFEIQDWASQQIVKCVDFKGVKKVWDACAGAGGKSLQLSYLMRNKGLLYASDIRLHKLEELKRRAKRANCQNIRVFEWDGGLPDWSKFPEVKEASFDLVFVDAPCSSSGVMRRNPELKYKILLDTFESFKKLQLKLLHNASSSVRLNGYLCYGTCSFLVAENEGIVEEFSSKDSRFKLIQQKTHGMPFADSDITFSALWQRVE